MATAFFASVGFAPASSGSSVSITLPGSIPADTVGILVLSNNSGSDTVSTPTNNGVGWTSRGSGTPGTTNISYLFSKDLGPADSGTSITANWSGSGKMSGGVVLISGAEWDTVSTVQTDNTIDQTATFNAVTPTAADAMLVAVAAGQHPSTTSILGWDSGWTSRLAQFGATALPVTSAVIYTKQLSGGPSAQTGLTGTWNASSRDVTWQAVVKPVLPDNYVGITTQYVTANTTSTTVSYPTGTTTGDYLIAFWGPNAPAGGDPSGWTMLEATGSGDRYAAAYRVCAGESSVAIARTANQVQRITISTWRPTGPGLSLQLVSAAARETGDISASKLDITTPSVTPTAAATLVAMMAASHTATGVVSVITEPSGTAMLGKVDVAGFATGVAYGVAGGTVASGATGNKDFTLNAAGTHAVSSVPWGMQVAFWETSATVTGTGATAGTAATLSGTGTVTDPAVTGTGGLTATAASSSGSGTLTVTATAALAAAAAVLAGSGALGITGSGALDAAAATVSGTGTITAPAEGTGALDATPGTLSGSGSLRFAGTGALAPTPATLSAPGDVALTGGGTLTATGPTLAGTSTVTIAGTGQLTATPSEVAGSGELSTFEPAAPTPAVRTVVISRESRAVTIPTESRTFTVAPEPREVTA